MLRIFNICRTLRVKKKIRDVSIMCDLVLLVYVNIWHHSQFAVTSFPEKTHLLSPRPLIGGWLELCRENINAYRLTHIWTQTLTHCLLSPDTSEVKERKREVWTNKKEGDREKEKERELQKTQGAASSGAYN